MVIVGSQGGEVGSVLGGSRSIEVYLHQLYGDGDGLKVRKEKSP